MSASVGIYCTCIIRPLKPVVHYRCSEALFLPENHSNERTRREMKIGLSCEDVNLPTHADGILGTCS